MWVESRQDLTQGAFYQELMLGIGRSTEEGFNWMCLYTLFGSILSFYIPNVNLLPNRSSYPSQVISDYI